MRQPGNRPTTGTERPQTKDLALLIHPEKCTGCRECEKACSARRTGRNDPAHTSVRIAASMPDLPFVPLHCSICSEAPCVAVCPGDALSRKREYGPVAIDAGKCSSCSSCVLSCPFEIIRLGDRTGLAEPCDLCSGAPECVKSCYEGALELVEADREHLIANRELAMRLAAIP